MSWILALVAAVILVARSWMLWRARAERGWRWWASWSVPIFALLVMLAELGAMRSRLEFEKLVSSALMPAALAWFALGALAATAAARGRRRMGLALAALFLLEGAAGNAWLGAALMAGLERGIAPIDPATVAPFDVVAVLGGGTDLAPDGRAQVVAGGDRVVIAAELFEAGKAGCLVATGSSIPGMDNPHDTGREAEAIWRSLGIPGERITAISGPRNTAEEIARLASEARERGWRRIGLVTSAWHMRRALRLCARAGLAVTPVPCDYRGDCPPWSLIWVIPHDRGFVKVQLGCWEYLGMMVGR